MFDLSSKFNTFYRNHVVLSQGEQTELYRKKDLNIERLKNGLDEYNQENETSYKIVDDVVQGSMAMSTVTQNDNNEYDIDVGIIFNKDNIPGDTKKVKQFVADSLKKKTRTFKTEPEVKTNAVTIEYAQGYHVDFAIYRRFFDDNGNYAYEHCGASWNPRDPNAITAWFLGENDENDNLRKVVRLLKMFCKSRSGWSMPGGLILSVLASESISIGDRMDVIFYNTITAIRDRLNSSQEVNNPVDSSISLLFNSKDKQKIKNLCTRLTTYINKLDILFDEVNCTEEKALDAWNEFFQHDYWGGLVENVQDSVSKSVTAEFTEAYQVDIDVKVRMNTFDWIPLSEVTGKLPKDRELKFTATPKFEYTRIQWQVRNEGDEAGTGTDHDHSGNQVTEWTRYRGTHRMLCLVFGRKSWYSEETLLATREVKIPIR